VTDLLKLLKENFNPQNAQDHTKEISRYYRSPGSSGIHAALEYCAEQYRLIGIEDVTIEKFPLDGETKIYGAEMYPAWEPVRASARIVSPVEEALAAYPETSTTIPWFSASTAPGGIEAEVVDVGSGMSPSDYQGKDLKGKIALAMGSSPDDAVRAYDLAVDTYGAIGLLADCLISPIKGLRGRKETPDFVTLLRLPRKFNEHWGLVVSSRNADRIRELLSQGPVKLHVEVETKMWKGEGENLVATIPGDGESGEQMIAIGHLSSTAPAANCASGPGLLIEVARTIHALVGSGELPRPQRSLKFLSVPEGLGSHAYLARHEDQIPKTLGGVCLCGVGQDQEKCYSSIIMARTPDSLPSFMNDLTYSFVQKNARGRFKPLRYTEVGYSPFSDNSTFNMAEVPMTLIASEPNLYFHTQYLTWETTSLEVFEATGLSLAATLLFVATASARDAVWLANTVVTNSEARLANKARTTVDRLLNGETDPRALRERVDRALGQLEFTYERDLAAIDSCLKLVPSKERPKVLPLLRSAKRDLGLAYKASRGNVEASVTTYAAVARAS
jgi:aminopeptidase YwaD